MRHGDGGGAGHDNFIGDLAFDPAGRLWMLARDHGADGAVVLIVYRLGPDGALGAPIEVIDNNIGGNLLQASGILADSDGFIWILSHGYDSPAGISSNYDGVLYKLTPAGDRVADVNPLQFGDPAVADTGDMGHWFAYDPAGLLWVVSRSHHGGGGNDRDVYLWSVE